ncbi:MAG: hypothetical protein JWP57_2595 [Spirosoma sp.]|nr:hypothetical protein [Spirosoma sp.]
MNKHTTFYRYLFWVILVLITGFVVVIGISTVWRADINSFLKADLIHRLRYILTGVGLVALIGYLLRYGKSWAKGTIISALIFMIFWLILEGLCGMILFWKERHQLSFSGRKLEKRATSRNNNFRLIRNDELGFSRPAPGQYESIYSTAKGEVRITYHIDSLSRRITPFDTRQATGKYAVFLGCSFTYGESVADSSTMPYFFGKETGYRPYNYGVSGHSPAHMLAILQTINIRKQILEKSGVAFYTYIDDHLARVSPSTTWAYNSSGYLPSVNPAKLVVDGSYAQTHPVRLKLVQWMYKSNIIKLFKINFPRRYSTKQYQHFANIVRKAKDLYQSQFGNDNFYVIIFPEYPLDPELRQMFEQSNLKLLDYSKLLSWLTMPAADGMHPDGDTYRKVAQQLAKDVGRETNRNSLDQQNLAYSNGLK